MGGLRGHGTFIEYHLQLELETELDDYDIGDDLHPRRNGQAPRPPVQVTDDDAAWDKQKWALIENQALANKEEIDSMSLPAYEMVDPPKPVDPIILFAGPPANDATRRFRALNSDEEFVYYW